MGLEEGKVSRLYGIRREVQFLVDAFILDHIEDVIRSFSWQ